MRKRRRRKRAKRRRRLWDRPDFKIYFGIVVVCFFVSGVLFFLVDKGTDALEEAKRLSAMVPEGVSLEDIGNIQEAVKGTGLESSIGNALTSGQGAAKALDKMKGTDQMENLKKNYLNKMDPAEVERLKKTYREYTGK